MGLKLADDLEALRELLKLCREFGVSSFEGLGFKLEMGQPRPEATRIAPVRGQPIEVAPAGAPPTLIADEDDPDLYAHTGQMPDFSALAAALGGSG